MTSLPQPETDSLRLELQEALTGLRYHVSVLIQVGGFMATADSLLLAYGFSQKIGIILLTASIVPVIMFAAYVQIINSVIPIIYAAMALEQKLQLRDVSLAAYYARTPARHIFSIYEAGADLTDPEVRKSILSPSGRNWLVEPTAYIVLFIFIVQIGLFLISLLVYHYRFM
jgi:hypothetical protein